MRVTIDFEVKDEGPQTPLIADLLAALAARETPAVVVPAEAVVSAEIAKLPKSAPAPKGDGDEADPRLTRKPRAKKEPEPAILKINEVNVEKIDDEPEPPADEDEPEEEKTTRKWTLDDAIARATDLVRDSKQPEIRKVLRSLGHNRVSELKGDEVDKFMEALA